MKALSQSEYGELRNLYESIYTPKVDLTEELLDEIFDELVDEYIEEGYSEEDAIEIVDEAVDLYIDEAKVTFGSDTAPLRASGARVGARRRYGKRKAGEALKAAGEKVKSAADSAKGAYKTAKAGVQIAGSIAKDEAIRARRKAAHAVTSAPDKAKASVDRKKKGIKGFIKRQAQKVVDRMSEELEAIGEDSRRMSNKQHTARVKANIKSFGSNYTPPSNYDPDANRGQGEVLTRKQIEKKRRKSLRQEELEATGLFSEMEIEAIMEADSLAAMQARREKRLAAQRKREGTTAAGNDFGHDYSLTPAQQKARRDAEYKAGMKKEEVEAVDEAMSSYDRNRKRAAQRAAARNAARDAGKTGAVPGVGYVTPRRERETYVDSAGVTRHKSGAKMEEFEAVDEALTGDRYKTALKKGKQYSRMVSADPTKRATRGGRGGESDFGAGDRGTGNRSRRRRGMSVGDED